MHANYYIKTRQTEHIKHMAVSVLVAYVFPSKSDRSPRKGQNLHKRRLSHQAGAGTQRLGPVAALLFFPFGLSRICQIKESACSKVCKTYEIRACLGNGAGQASFIPLPWKSVFAYLRSGRPNLHPRPGRDTMTSWLVSVKSVRQVVPAGPTVTVPLLPYVSKQTVAKHR